MEDCKLMATHMITNLKKATTLILELVDPMMYRQLIGSLMYLLNTMPNICFVLNIVVWIGVLALRGVIEARYIEELIISKLM